MLVQALWDYGGRWSWNPDRGQRGIKGKTTGDQTKNISYVQRRTSKADCVWTRRCPEEKRDALQHCSSIC